MEKAHPQIVKHIQAGRYAKAVRLCAKTVQRRAEPVNVDTVLGIIAQQAEDHAFAVDRFQRAIGKEGDLAFLHHRLGLSLLQLGQLQEAGSALRMALLREPDNETILKDLEQLRHAEVNATFDQKTPLDSTVILRKAIAAHQSGQLDEAVKGYQKVLSTQPDFPLVLNNLGIALHAQGHKDAAIPLFQKALTLQPDYVDARFNLGNVLNNRGDLDGAIEQYRRVLDYRPEEGGVWINLGIALMGQRRLGQAEESFRNAIRCNPKLAEAHNNLGAVLRHQARLDEAAESYLTALRIKPDYADAHSNLGNVFLDQGLLQEAISHYRSALTLRPDHAGTHFNLLGTLLYLPGQSNSALFSAIRQTVQTIRPKAIGSLTEPHPSLDARPRLRIGYLSSDFRDHPVGRNLLPLLEHHDKKRYEIFCYAQVEKKDAITRRLQNCSDHWRTLNALSDQRAAALIRSDHIHIQVHLASMFDKNRPLVAALRPAPIQVSYHNGTTTGLEEMDYWLTDRFLHPEESTEQFTETLIKLPVFYVYDVTEETPPVAPSPMDRNGFITFASFNKPTKINDTVLETWAAILHQVTGSRLMLKYHNFLQNPGLRKNLLARLNQHGISTDRVTLLSASDKRWNHLTHYNQVDIALDPFPFNGATTTFQAMWMGIPVITMPGERFISRMAGDIIVHAGLESLTAPSIDVYVERAVKLANNLPRLRELRGRLRQQLQNSLLCDGPAYARSVEQAYEMMWTVYKTKHASTWK